MTRMWQSCHVSNRCDSITCNITQLWVSLTNRSGQNVRIHVQGGVVIPIARSHACTKAITSGSVRPRSRRFAGVEVGLMTQCWWILTNRHEQLCLWRTSRRCVNVFASVSANGLASCHLCTSASIVIPMKSRSLFLVVPLLPIRHHPLRQNTRLWVSGRRRAYESIVGTLGTYVTVGAETGFWWK